MAQVLQLTVVSPERALVDVEAQEVVVPGLGGYLGILPGHAPLFSELSIGLLSYKSNGGGGTLAIAGGFVEVLDDQVRVLATVAESDRDIDPARATEAYRRAQARLRGESAGEDRVDYDRALRAAHRAAARLEVVGRVPDAR
jgi:F-type H+-transporting ATPase subunit epsilon